MNAADLGVVTTVAQRVVRETMRQAQRGGLSVPVNRPGTLVAWNGDFSLAQVTVDGDAFPIEVTNALDDTIPVGTRVLVHFEPPHGAFLWRIIGLPPSAPQTWVPTWFGGSAALGDSTYSARYTKRGVDVRGTLTIDIGASGVMATDELGIALPTAMRDFSVDGQAHAHIGTAMYYDTGSNALYAGSIYVADFFGYERMQFRALQNFLGGVEVLQSVATTMPFTWVADDRIWCKFEYEAAEP